MMKNSHPRHRTSLIHHMVLITLTCLLFSAPAAAQETPIPLLRFPTQSLTAGQSASLFAYYHNETIEILPLSPPPSLMLELINHSGTTRLLDAHATTETPMVELLPGQFYRLEYQLALPQDLSAILDVRLAEYPDAITRINVEPALHLAEAANAGDGNGSATVTYRSLKDMESLYQSYTADLFTYEPIYFLVGSDPSKSTFQLSFKYRLLNRSGTLSQKYPWLSGLFFAYTQTSFWDLDSDSIPFNDTSYKPQLMFQTENLSRLDAMAGFFVRSGLSHESNGRDGSSSRSTNYFYLKPMAVFYHQASRLGIMISPKFLVYVNNEDDTNPDLPDYRGHVELETRIGRAHSLMLTTNLRFARKGTSVQTDLTYPIDRLIGNNLNVYLHLQYSNSLAESLVDYKERSEVFRLGLSFFR
ncbi:phospholipase A [Pelovirga terrestris]|uniref:Phosphatidylcholine 1-acylhydrolase n=1 Tax=Pelovirga terrestris TaxID=2771352 RepID=A0A8J6UQU9_9BACT|nr:phospholipase A [Pelovirga terrestris]MBD1399676.1 phospholipase A [Pelovirga terrestris]